MQFGGRRLDLAIPRVMGIINATPDSFSDGGSLYSNGKVQLDKVLYQAEAMVNAGVDFLDVGGESTRPGAELVGETEEMARVLPVIEKLSSEFNAIISVDTSSAALMECAAACGAGLINDVRALGQPGALAAASRTGLPVCIMHMQGSPATMQDAPVYDDVLDDVADFFSRRIVELTTAGIAADKIILDPGFGFGKALQHNLRLLNRLGDFQSFGLPLLVGTSRKTMVGQVLDREVDGRLYGSLATVAISVANGAQIIRVHDVEQTMDVVRMCHAINIEDKGDF